VQHDDVQLGLFYAVLVDPKTAIRVCSEFSYLSVAKWLFIYRCVCLYLCCVLIKYCLRFVMSNGV
jgi:hypothetical protein